MKGMEQRRIVYAGLLVACGMIALMAGPWIGVWGFIEAAVMIELGNWLVQRRGYYHRRHW